MVSATYPLTIRLFKDNISVVRLMKYPSGIITGFV